MSSSSSPEPRRYLIAIGSSMCPKMELPKLQNVESDIDKVTNLFKEQGYERVLSDQIPLDETAVNIKDPISKWFASRERQPSDCVIIYYGGHGDEGGRFGSHYLFTFDSVEDQLERTAIETGDFVKLFFPGNGDKSPQNVLLILDVCYANSGGRQISESLGKLTGVTPTGSGFSVICSSDTNTEAGDGVFVEALCAVMNSTGQFKKDGEFIPIETLVDCINQHFTDNQQAQRAIWHSQGGQKKTIFFRNPRYITGSKKELTKQPKKCSQLVNCLWSLNYCSQTRSFQDNIHKSGCVAAFVVQAKDRRIQDWLVRRLFNQLPNFTEALVFKFVIPVHEMWKNGDFNELWLDFARPEHLQCQADRTTILNKLVELYQTKPVIIAMYGWEKRSRLQQLQQQVLSDFWHPLVEKVGKLQNQPTRSRLVLFLVGKATEDQIGVDDRQCSPIRLDPLTEISCQDVANWLDSKEVSNVLRQIQTEDFIRKLIEEEIKEWDKDPVETLEQICYLFNLENGITNDIESEWELKSGS